MNNKIKTNLEFLKKNNINYKELNFNVFLKRPKNISSDIICKTLVLKSKDIGTIIAVVSFDQKVSFKKLKSILNIKNITMEPNLEDVTGYPHGANGPIGIYLKNSSYPIIFDEKLKDKKELVSNIGEFGKTVVTNKEDLIKLVNGKYGDITD